MRSHRILALASVAILALAGCANSPSSPSGSTQAQPTKIEMLVPFPPSILRPGLIMAQDRFFAEEGLDVTVTTVDGSSVVAQQLIAGNAVIGLLDVASILIANADGNDIRSIASFNHDVFNIVVPDGSDISSVEDLAGKTLGVTDLSGGEMNLVRAALADASLEPDTDVTVLAVGEGGPASYQALQDGTIDAFAGAINDFVALEGEGFLPRSIVPDKYRNLPAGNFVVMQSTLDDDALRSTVIRLVRAHEKGLVFADENIDAALDIACEVLPEQCEDRERARATMARGLAGLLPAEGDQWGQNDLEAWQTTEDTLLADALETPFDVSVAAPNDLIGEINNFDEDAIRASARDGG